MRLARPARNRMIGCPMVKVNTTIDTAQKLVRKSGGIYIENKKPKHYDDIVFFENSYVDLSKNIEKFNNQIIKDETKELETSLKLSWLSTLDNIPSKIKANTLLKNDKGYSLIYTANNKAIVMIRDKSQKIIQEKIILTEEI